MKVLFAFVMLTTVSATAQNKSLSPVLTDYYKIKNELVAGNSSNSANAAADLKSAISSVDAKSLDANGLKVFESVKQKIMSDAGTIASSKDIKQQRELFSSLSVNMIALAKSVSLSGGEIYVNYCPMKKSYWLSAEKAIRNPYYGSSMLTCGSIKETIKP